jgi:hypothetical protein
MTIMHRFGIFTQWNTLIGKKLTNKMLNSKKSQNNTHK